MSRDGMILTPWAEDDALDFYREYGLGNCSCFISPPCGSCTHPGNPLNQAETDECWEPEDFSERIAFRLDAARQLLHMQIDSMKGGAS